MTVDTTHMIGCRGKLDSVCKRERVMERAREQERDSESERDGDGGVRGLFFSGRMHSVYAHAVNIHRSWTFVSFIWVPFFGVETVHGILLYPTEFTVRAKRDFTRPYKSHYFVHMLDMFMSHGTLSKIFVLLKGITSPKRRAEQAKGPPKRKILQPDERDIWGHDSVHFYDMFTIGWLRLVGSLKLLVSFVEYRLFYRSLLHKRPVVLRSLLVAASP